MKIRLETLEYVIEFESDNFNLDIQPKVSEASVISPANITALGVVEQQKDDPFNLK